MLTCDTRAVRKGAAPSKVPKGEQGAHTAGLDGELDRFWFCSIRTLSLGEARRGACLLLCLLWWGETKHKDSARRGLSQRQAFSQLLNDKQLFAYLLVGFYVLPDD